MVKNSRHILHVWRLSDDTTADTKERLRMLKLPIQKHSIFELSGQVWSRQKIELLPTATANW